MHILFLSDNFPPEVNAPATRTFEHCREWVKAGHSVTVITCAPNFPKGRVFDGYRNRIWQSEYVAGIRVIRVWSFIARNEGFLKRTLDYVSYMVTAVLASFLVRRVDVIIGTSPQFFSACAAYLVAIAKRRPWIFELRDIWPESIRAVGAMDSARAFKLLEKLELHLYRKATTIVSLTHSFKDNLISRGIDRGKIHVITNGVDINSFVSVPKPDHLQASLGLTGKFVAGYIGTHGMAHGLHTLIDAALLLRERRHDHIRILMVGDGALRAELKARAREEGLGNILFIDTVPRDQIRNYWSLLDVSIIHLKNEDLFKTVIPSKIFEAMAMAIPVLHGVSGESADIVTQHRVGHVFKPENAEDLVEKIIILERNEDLKAEFSRNGPQVAQLYDRSVLAARMLEIITQSTRSAADPSQPTFEAIE